MKNVKSLQFFCNISSYRISPKKHKIMHTLCCLCQLFFLLFLFLLFFFSWSHTKILSKHRVLGNSLKNTVCPQISRAAFTLSARSSYTDTHTKSNVDRSKFFERSERFEPRAILYQSASVMLYTKRL